MISTQDALKVVRGRRRYSKQKRNVRRDRRNAVLPQIARCIAVGKSITQCAQECGIPIVRVEGYLHRIYQDWGCRDMYGLVLHEIHKDPTLRQNLQFEAGDFTAQEKKILDALIGGPTNKELARSLGCEPSAIKVSIAKIKKKITFPPDRDKRILLIHVAITLAMYEGNFELPVTMLETQCIET